MGERRLAAWSTPPHLPASFSTLRPGVSAPATRAFVFHRENLPRLSVASRGAMMKRFRSSVVVGDRRPHKILSY